MKDVKNGESGRARGKYTRGWRQCIYYPFGENGTERIYVPGNLEEHVVLWLGDHLERGRDRPKSDFLFLVALKEIFHNLFIGQQALYTSSNGIVMAFRDLRQPSSPAIIMFPVVGSEPAKYELPRWKIVEALRVMEALDKIRRGMPLDEAEKPPSAESGDERKVNGAIVPAESAVENGARPAIVAEDPAQLPNGVPDSKALEENTADSANKADTTPGVTP